MMVMVITAWVERRRDGAPIPIGILATLKYRELAPARFDIRPARVNYQTCRLILMLPIVNGAMTCQTLPTRKR